MPEPECVNLMERFGEQYKITFDPAYDPKHRPRELLDPWMMTVACRPGVIYPYGGTELAIEVDGHRFVRAALSKLPCCREHQRGDDCGSFIFDVEDFDSVAEVVKPKRRKQISEAERARLVAMGAKHRFQPRLSGRPTDSPSPASVPT